MSREDVFAAILTAGMFAMMYVIYQQEARLIAQENRPLAPACPHRVAVQTLAGGNVMVCAP